MHNNVIDARVASGKRSDRHRSKQSVRANEQDFWRVHDAYINEIANTIGGLLEKAAPITAPKSSDSQWHLMIPELLGQAPVEGRVISLEDRVRTAEYFSAYVFVQSLSLLPEGVRLPVAYVVCGGGWKNPVSRMAFEQLVAVLASSDAHCLPAQSGIATADGTLEPEKENTAISISLVVMAL